MKKVLFSAFLFLATIAVFAQEKKISDVARFESDTITLGNIKQGNPTKGTFNVTNISPSPLIIEQANPTCGCTISDYTKEPIAAGKAGVINATYNAAGVGHFEKHLTVKFAGVNEMKTITLKGDVLAAADYDKWKAENDAKLKADADAKAAVEAAKKPVKKPIRSRTTVRRTTAKRKIVRRTIKKKTTTTVKKPVVAKKVVVAPPSN